MGYGSPGGSETFLGLLDTPAAYTGQALKLAKVNAGETALSLDLLLSFTDWYAGGAPTSYPWEFDAILPYTPGTEGHFFSPILENVLGQKYVYVVGYEADQFYLYNITTKQWHKKANLVTARSYYNYRPLSINPSKTKLAAGDGAGTRIEIYDIASNTWTRSSAPPASIGGKTVWVDDDTVWCANKASPLKCFRYVVSTDTWTSFANSQVAAQANPSAIACTPDMTTLYLGGCGSFYYTVIKYVIATDTYSEMSPQSNYLGSQRRVLFCSDRVRIWYTYEGDYAVHYFQCSDETRHTNQFPASSQRDKPSNWSAGFEDLKSALVHWRSAEPRNQSYFGTGSWRLAQKVLTDYNAVVIEKPNDGFSISIVNTGDGYYIPVDLFDTLILPAGTWEFFYPKDGDYTKLKISGSVLK